MAYIIIIKRLTKLADLLDAREGSQAEFLLLQRTGAEIEEGYKANLYNGRQYRILSNYVQELMDQYRKFLTKGMLYR